MMRVQLLTYVHGMHRFRVRRSVVVWAKSFAENILIILDQYGNVGQLGEFEHLLDSEAGGTNLVQSSTSLQVSDTLSGRRSLLPRLLSQQLGLRILSVGIHNRDL